MAERTPPARSCAVPVYFDFASVLSYVAHRVLGRLVDPLGAVGVRLEWRPVDLTGLAAVRRDHAIDPRRRRHVLGIARALVGEVRAPVEWPDSRAVSGIALVLAGTAAETTWRERVFTAIFEEGRDPGARETVEGCLRDLALDPALSEPPLSGLAVATDEARGRGIAAVPTLLLGEWPMAGIQDDATMLAVLTRFARRA